MTKGFYQEAMNGNIPGDAPTGYITSSMGWTSTGQWGMRFQWNHLKKDGTIVSGESDYSSYKGALSDLQKFLRL